MHNPEEARHRTKALRRTEPKKQPLEDDLFEISSSNIKHGPTNSKDDTSQVSTEPFHSFSVQSTFSSNPFHKSFEEFLKHREPDPEEENDCFETSEENSDIKEVTKSVDTSKIDIIPIEEPASIKSENKANNNNPLDKTSHKKLAGPKFESEASVCKNVDKKKGKICARNSEENRPILESLKMSVDKLDLGASVEGDVVAGGDIAPDVLQGSVNRDNLMDICDDLGRIPSSFPETEELEDIVEEFGDNSAFSAILMDDQYLTSVQCHTGSIMSVAPIFSAHDCSHNLHRSYKCSQCRNVYPNLSDIIAHTCEGPPIVESTTESDDSSSSDNEFFQQHSVNQKLNEKTTVANRNQSKAKPYTCKICQKVFATFRSVNRHKCLPREPTSKNHTLKKSEKNVSFSKKRPYKCHICKRDFMMPQSLTNHKCAPKSKKLPSNQSHAKSLNQSVAKPPVKPIPRPALIPSFKCNKCCKLFTRKSNLQKHLKQIHNSNRTHLCKLCGITFADVKRLKCHLLTHSSAVKIEAVKTEITKPCGCTTCGEEFWLISDLKDHVRFVHPQISEVMLGDLKSDFP